MTFTFQNDITLDAMKVRMTWQGEATERTIDEERRAYGNYLRIGGVPTNREYCFALAGAVGEGSARQWGPYSEEVCQ